MKILITGSTGFIGKNLVEYLSGKHQILAPSHKELELTDEYAVRKYWKEQVPEMVIHAANVGGTRKNKNNPQDLQYNLRMFFNLANNLKDSQRMLFLGSGADYKRNRNIKNVREKDFGEILPEDAYGFAKYVCSKYAEKTENITNLRLFGVFGKYEDYEIRFMSNMICRSILGLPLEVNQNRKMEMVSVEDICRITERFVEKPPEKRAYNIGANRPKNLVDIAEQIARISKRQDPIIIKQQGDGFEYTCDSSRLLKELSEFQFTPLDESIRRLYQWYESIKDSIKKENLLVY